MNVKSIIIYMTEKKESRNHKRVFNVYVVNSHIQGG